MQRNLLSSMSDGQLPSVAIKEYVAFIWRWAWLIVLSTALAGSIAYGVSRCSTPVYEGSITLLISASQDATRPNYDSQLLDERLAKTYAQMLKARPVLAEAGARLGLALTGEEISVEPVRDTQIVQIKARHSDPNMAAKIANTIPQVFVEQNEQAHSARVASSSANLKREMDALQVEMAATQASLDAERAKLAGSATELARLEALLAQHRSTYSDLLRSYQEMRVAEARGASVLTVVESAVAPSEPISPRTATDTALATAVGAMLALGAAFLVEYLDDTIKQASDVERATGLPVLAGVARFSKGADEAFPPTEASDSVLMESYRMLRTNVQFAALSMGHSAVILMVSSALPEEGKTTALTNLGVSLAQAGKRVLLVDTDLRRPALHRRFGLQNKAGLTSLLLDREPDPGRYLQKTGVKGLRVLTAGPMKASPAELLDLPSTAVVLDGLRALADYVLLDSPPVLSAADASILAQRADGVVLVAEAGRVRREAFSEAVTTLQRVNAKVVGVVLNKVSAKVGGVVLNKVSAKLGGVVLNKVSAKLGGHAYRHSHYRSTPVNEGRGRRKETPHPAERRTRGLLRRGFRPQQ